MTSFEDDDLFKAMEEVELGEAKPERPKLDLAGVAPAAGGEATGYAASALALEAFEVAHAMEGVRNHTLNKAGYSIGQLCAAGHLDAHHALDVLTDAGFEAGLSADEIDRTLPRAMEDGARHPREVVLTGGAVVVTDWEMPELREAASAATPAFVAPPDCDNNTIGPDDTAEQQTIESVYPVLDWHKVFSGAPEDVEWIAYPLFEKGRLYGLYSPAKAGKSLFILDVVASLAAGRAVLGAPAGRKRRVLYVDLENSETDLVDRLTKLGYAPAELDDLKYLSFPNLPELDTAQGGQHLTAVAKHYEAEIVVIDTVSRVIQGDENDANTFNALYRHAMMPLKAADVCVIRLDHTGKDESKGMRGSSAKVSDVDAAWKLTRPAKGRIRLDRTATRNTNSPEWALFAQEDDPVLRHLFLPEEGDDGVAELIATMDRLGIPDDSGSTRSRKLLKENGYKCANGTLAQAIRWRKARTNSAPE